MHLLTYLVYYSNYVHVLYHVPRCRTVLLQTDNNGLQKNPIKQLLTLHIGLVILDTMWSWRNSIWSKNCHVFPRLNFFLALSRNSLA